MIKQIDTIIEEYISEISKTNKVVGCFICGSYINGGYNNESDIDTLFLVKNSPFEMILEEYKNILFDKLVVDPELLLDILLNESPLSNILSLSLGSKQKIVIDSKHIASIIEQAKNNIQNRSLIYIKKNKTKKVVDGNSYTVKKIDSIYRLVRNNQMVI